MREARPSWRSPAAVWLARPRSTNSGGTGGRSASPLVAATRAAAAVGILRFAGDTPFHRTVVRLAMAVGYAFKWVYHTVRGAMQPRPNADSALAAGDWSVIFAVFSRKTPKEIFLLHYGKIERKRKRDVQRIDSGKAP